MANWSKRTILSGGKKNGGRYTRTINSSGKSTSSTSYKMGKVRITSSVNSNGKQMRTVTTRGPLGVKREVLTLNKKPPRVRKAATTRPRKTTTYKPRKTRTSKSKAYTGTYYGSSQPNDEPMSNGCLALMIVVGSLIVLSWIF